MAEVGGDAGGTSSTVGWRHPRARLRRAVCAAAVLLAVGTVAGCSTVRVPFTPGPWFEPSPTPAPAATLPDRPDVDLSGPLDTTRGLTARVHTDLWFGTLTPSATPVQGGHPHWRHVHLQVHGSLTVTSTSRRPNRAASSVYYEVVAAYPAGSTVCRVLVDPGAGPDDDGGPCWVPLATVTPFSYEHGPPVALAAGTARSVRFGAAPFSAGASVDAPAGDLAAVGAELSRPDRVVVLSVGIADLGVRFRFADACPGASTSDTEREQHVLVGATGPTTCAELQQAW